MSDEVDGKTKPVLGVLVRPTDALRNSDALVGPAEPCTLCGGEIGPDITGRPMCYGCGPRNMAPTEKRRPEEISVIVGIDYASGRDRSAWTCRREGHAPLYFVTVAELIEHTREAHDAKQP